MTQLQNLAHHTRRLEMKAMLGDETCFAYLDSVFKNLKLARLPALLFSH